MLTTNASPATPSRQQIIDLLAGGSDYAFPKLVEAAADLYLGHRASGSIHEAIYSMLEELEEEGQVFNNAMGVEDYAVVAAYLRNVEDGDDWHDAMIDAQKEVSGLSGNEQVSLIFELCGESQ